MRANNVRHIRAENRYDRLEGYIDDVYALRSRYTLDLLSMTGAPGEINPGSEQEALLSGFSVTLKTVDSCPRELAS